jgi:hypothetical protein
MAADSAQQQPAVLRTREGPFAATAVVGADPSIFVIFEELSDGATAGAADWPTPAPFVKDALPRARAVLPVHVLCELRNEWTSGKTALALFLPLLVPLPLSSSFFLPVPFSLSIFLSTGP